MPKRRDQSQPALRREANAPVPSAGPASPGARPAQQPTASPSPAAASTHPQPHHETAAEQKPMVPTPQRKPRPIPFDDNDDLDVPDFLK
jgi:cell division protein FtsZ